MKTASPSLKAMPDAPFLSVRGLSKFFGPFCALNNVSLDVRRGEFICFLGPSGCGKTTLLRAIAGLDQQSAGEIHINGRDVSNALPAERDFGIVFQSYALFPNLTVSDNIGYGLNNRKLGRAAVQARVSELLALVDLTDHAAKYPAQLSGGQQQRVALSRALATSPGLLLLDEPLSALDARVRLRLRDEIRGLQRRLGVTTIMVTHDQEEALSMADRIVVMNNGLVEQIGTPQEIYGQPATAFVADFVGRLTMLKGVMSGHGKVRLGETILACSDKADLAKGEAVDVALRPEAVQILDRKVGKNSLKARVESIEFLGSYSRANLSFGKDFTCLADFSANVMQERKISAGQTIAVALPADALRVFAARPQAQVS